MKPVRQVLVILVMTGLSGVAAWGREFRSIVPIGKGTAAARGSSAEGQGLGSDLGFVQSAVERRAVALAREAAGAITQAWNTPGFGTVLSSVFYDRDRLLDSFVTKVPRDALLRLLGVERVQPLTTTVVAGAGGHELTFVTRVSVTLRTQVEYDDSLSGLVRVEGRNELILTVRLTLDLETAGSS